MGWPRTRSAAREDHRGEGGVAAGADPVDADAETSAVRAIVTLHDGVFLPPEAEGPDVQFTIQFNKRA